MKTIIYKTIRNVQMSYSVANSDIVVIDFERKIDIIDL